MEVVLALLAFKVREGSVRGYSAEKNNSGGAGGAIGIREEAGFAMPGLRPTQQPLPSDLRGLQGALSFGVTQALPALRAQGVHA